MRKKLIGALFAAMLLVALPSAAFAAGSASSEPKTVGGVTATAVDADVSGMTVSGPGTGLGTYEVNGITINEGGSVTLTFTVGTSYAGQSVFIKCTHHDGSVESWTKTVASDGTVSVTVSKMSTFEISAASGASNTSATSAKTGVDLNIVGFATLATVIVAGGVFWALRKQEQR